MPSIIKKNKNNEIQFLRAIFCICILLFHFTTQYEHLYLDSGYFANPFLSNLGKFGVFAFALISGLFLVSEINDGNILIKWLKRFLNIYIPYLVAITIIYLFSLSGLLGVDRSVSFTEYLKNFVFLQEFTYTRKVDSALWYVFVLFIVYFYGFIGDLFKKFSLNYRAYWIVVGLISSLVLIFNCLNLNGALGKVFFYANFIFAEGYLPIFCLGVYMSLFIRSEKSIVQYILLGIVSIFCLSSLSYENVVNLVFSTIAIPLVFLAAIKKLRFLDRNIIPFTLIGNISLSIYLIHQNIGFGFMNLILRCGIPLWLSIIIVFHLMIGIGFLFHYLVILNIRKFVGFVFKYFSLNKHDKTETV